MTKEFLTLAPPEDALKLFLANIPRILKETIEKDVSESLGYVTAIPVTALEPSPTFPRSTMDGYAVRARDTHGAGESLPAYLVLAGEVPMGKAPDFSLVEGQAALIHTGGMLPTGADAVVMVENTQMDSAGHVEIYKPVAIWENMTALGEDVSPGEEIIPAGRRIRPMEIGGMLSMGLQMVQVAKPPRVGILSSGDEVVSPDEIPGIGQVRDINSYSLGTLIQQFGGLPIYYGIIPDIQTRLDDGIRKAMEECDLVVVTAGSSVSSRDMTARVIQSLGKPGVLVHGLNIRPGKPTILAVCNGKPVIGLPGNPVSALVIARLFVVPVLEHLLGMNDHPRFMIRARLTINLPSTAGREDWVPVKLLATDRGYDAEPVFYKSSLIFSLVRADGLAHIPAEVVGVGAGEDVQVLMV